MSAATQSVANTVDALRRQAAEDSQKTLGLLETRLGAIQTSVNEKLHEAVEQQMTNSFARVLEQFAQVQQAMGEVQSAAAQIGDLKRIFSNVKTRGGWGEAQLGAMLEQVLPPGAFERNFALRDGARERVDFAIRMPSRELLWLPVDAKFPTEDYERLLLAAETADLDAERAAREGIAVRIRLEAKKIAEKYICPPETVEFGVMYLPSDGLFAEVARIPEPDRRDQGAGEGDHSRADPAAGDAADHPSRPCHARPGEAGRRDRQAPRGDARGNDEDGRRAEQARGERLGDVEQYREGAGAHAGDGAGAAHGGDGRGRYRARTCSGSRWMRGSSREALFVNKK